MFSLVDDLVAGLIVGQGSAVTPASLDIAGASLEATKAFLEGERLLREGDYRAELERRTGWQPTPGPLVDADGATVGGVPARIIAEGDGRYTKAAYLFVYDAGKAAGAGDQVGNVSRRSGLEMFGVVVTVFDSASYRARSDSRLKTSRFSPTVWKN